MAPPWARLAPSVRCEMNPARTALTIPTMMLASALGRANVPMIRLPNQPTAVPMEIQRIAIPRLMPRVKAASGPSTGSEWVR